MKHLFYLFISAICLYACQPEKDEKTVVSGVVVDFNTQRIIKNTSVRIRNVCQDPSAQQLIPLNPYDSTNIFDVISCDSMGLFDTCYINMPGKCPYLVLFTDSLISEKFYKIEQGTNNLFVIQAKRFIDYFIKIKGYTIDEKSSFIFVENDSKIFDRFYIKNEPEPCLKLRLIERSNCELDIHINNQCVMDTIIAIENSDTLYIENKELR